MLTSRVRALVVDNLPLWLRPLLVVGLLVISVALTSVISPERLRWVLVGLAGAAAALIFLRWPVIGLIAASMAGGITSYVGPGGLNVTIALVAMLLGLWVVDMLARQRQLRLVSSRTVWPLLAFLAVAVVAFAMGQPAWYPFAVHAPLDAQLGGFAIVVLSVGTMLLASNQLRSLAELRWLTWAFLVFAAIFILLRSVLPFLGVGTAGWLRPLGSAFFIWPVALAFSQALINRDLAPGWRLALFTLVAVYVWVMLFLKFADKSGWIPTLVCLAVILGLRYKRVLPLLLSVGALVALYLAPQLLEAENYSVATRFEAWVIIAQIVKVSPIWGLGFANYYWYTPLFPIRGYAVSFNSHNNYVDLVAQMGLAGLTCFVWLLWETGRLGWRLRQTAPAGFAQAYVYGALGGLVATAVVAMLGDWVVPFAYNIGLTGFRSSVNVWLFLGGLVCLEQLVNSTRPSR